MTTLIDLKKAPIFTEANSVKMICKPLQELGITDFFFMRIFPDGTLLDLATHVMWGEHFFSNLYQRRYNRLEVQAHLFADQSINLWESHPESKIWQEGKEFFNVGNGISLVKKYKEYSEVFSFFTDRKNIKMNEFYLMHLELFEKFTSYFKERAKSLIQAADKRRLIIPYYYQKQENQAKDETDKKIQSFLEKIDRSDSFYTLKELPKLTKREIECLTWISNGKSAEEIGMILGCSKRTVEIHLNSIKSKMETSKITRSVYLAAKLGLI